MIICLLIVILLPGLTCLPALSSEVTLLQSQLLDQINWARANPTAAAKQVEIDAKTRFTDLPEWKAALENGMQSLKLSSHLTQTAATHLTEMLQANYYSKVALDGRTAEDRIKEDDYWPLSTGEMLGVVAFKNLMDIDTAVNILFANMLKEALNANNAQPGPLFDPNLTDVGLALATGKLSLGGTARNVYLLVCDFAQIKTLSREVIGTIEQHLLFLVNQFRNNPMGIGRSLGVDMDAIMAGHPEMEAIFSTPLPPLVPSLALEAVAITNNGRMIASQSLASVPIDSLELEMNSWTGFVDAFAISSIASAPEVGVKILQSMLAQEVETYSKTGALTLLDPEMQNIGIAMGANPLKLSEELTDSLFFTILTGVSRVDSPPYIAVAVWRDADQDGACLLGEGLPDMDIIIESAEPTETEISVSKQVTDSTGLAFFAVNPGIYRVTVQQTGTAEKTTCGKVVDKTNVWLEKRID